MSTSDVDLLYEVSSKLNSDLDIDRVLADVLHLTVRRVGAENGSILIFDEKGTVAHKILARHGLPSEQADAVIEEVLDEGLAGWVVAQRRGAVIGNVLSDARWITFPDDDFLEGSAVGVPLLRRDRVVGVLTLRHRDTDRFTDAQFTLLTSIADQAVIAIENARLFYSVRAEKAKMEAIINGAGDAVLVTDERGHVLLMNPVARQAFGISHACDGSGSLLVELIQNPALIELWMSRQSQAHRSMAEVPLADGSTFHATLTSVPSVGHVIVLQDITYLKELSEMRSQFVSTVSHDLRSPLQLIMTYTNLLSESGSMTQQQQSLVDGIGRGVQKMGDLIDDLMELAKIEAGVDMATEECHLDQVIIEVGQRFEEMIDRRGIRLLVDVPSDLPPVEANVRRIDQVLSNLLDNAAKYTASGTIVIRAVADGQQVTVHVSDTGIGLMPQEQKRLFTKFYRAKNELTEEIEGTGLGLVVVKSIIEQYGGKVWVESNWQKGSTFSLSLPQIDQR